MANYIQENRILEVTTPLGPDKLLLTGFSGQEGISQLFHFHLDLVAENDQEIQFEKLLGQKITVRVGRGGKYSADQSHYFNGITAAVSQGSQDDRLTSYQIQMVPMLWLLTRKVQSRIFQHKTVPDILKEVLTGIDVEFEIRGDFEQREYCVQYRETDFEFASRLMEEEGIYYFFKHTKDGHKMVLANTPQSHPEIPWDSKLIFEQVEGGAREEERISAWEKMQELRSGKTTLWDHHFELPHKHLETEKTILPTVEVGKVTHQLKVGNNDKLELYDYPGAYAQRFDGIDKGGGQQPDKLQKIFEDNLRTVGIRMQQEALPSLVIRGDSNCRQLMSGYKFTLTRHFNGNGQYVFTSVTHSARETYETGKPDSQHYSNSFTCIPLALPFRPQRLTPKPTVHGTQTAIVEGPDGEEIFTDKYGRVKVQFHWDRQGKHDADSSCWVRVGTPWAGTNWGAIQIPRIGQEVIVDFLEGDPDRPIVIGSVYNAREMPPYTLPDHKTVSTVKSRSSKGGTTSNFNELRFEDIKGGEQVFLHAEMDKDERVKMESREFVGARRHLIVKEDQLESVGGGKSLSVGGDHKEKINGNMSLAVQQDLKEKISGSHSVDVTMNHDEKIGMNYALDAGAIIHIKAGMTAVIEAGAQLTLIAGGSFVDISAAGVAIQGTMVLINSGGAPGSAPSANPSSPDSPDDPDKADDGSQFMKLS